MRFPAAGTTCRSVIRGEKRDTGVTVSQVVSLNRNTFCQISGLVHVTPSGNGRMVCDELQGHYAQQGLQRLNCVWDVDHVIAVPAYVLVAFGGDCDDPSAAGPDLLDVADHLVILKALGGNEDDG